MGLVIHESLRRNNRLTTLAGKLFLKVSGWEIIGNIPNIKKVILIVGPHTSNWDFVISAFVASSLDVKGSFFGKHTLFKIPIIKSIMYWFGGIAVNREYHHGFVQQMVENFKNRDSLLLALSPEGTRKKVKKWKTGFYQIALNAEIPILPLVLDYKKKVVKFNEILTPSGNIEKDFNYFLDVFRNCTPQNPENFNFEKII